MAAIETSATAVQRSVAPEAVGRVAAMTGSEATIDLSGRVTGANGATVGKFLAVTTAKNVVVGLITEISEQAVSGGFRKIAEVDLIGEIRNEDGSTRFRRGVSDYPSIGDVAAILSDAELKMIYGSASSDRVEIGHLQQNPSVRVHIDIEQLVTKHFAIVGTTGVGKSNGVASILQRILDTRSSLRIFLIDPHNEYGRCFGDKAQVLNPRNLKLPFWLFNFEEAADAFFSGRPGVPEEMEILSEAIALAKGAYLQYRGNNNDSLIAKKREARSTSFTADTPVPYRIEDLLAIIDEQMGKLENRSSRMVYHKLMTRIQTIRNHPRYAFMFENANIGGDTMAETLCQLFRLPPQDKPMTVMQLAGFPAEVVDSVVSVLSRMAFDFGLWSDGVSPLLFVCEEAHRYAPADGKIGFGPTRRALSRIAKEGRKYGVFLGLITQRPAEIDPNIISQCSTLFVMRLSNDRDQALIRSAASDAASNLLSFIPSLGMREAFVLGPGVGLPTRMTFSELPKEKRPNSESANIRSDGGSDVTPDLIPMVIERWRSATANQKTREFEVTESQPSPSPLGAQQPALQRPAAPQSPPLQPGQRPDLRSSLLKKPLDASIGTQPNPLQRLR
jgi:DNA helicase HerA-like ATPase